LGGGHDRAARLVAGGVGEGSGGLDEYRKGLAAYRATGAKVAKTFLLALLAELEGAVGHADQATATVGQALQAVATSGVRCWESELHRLNGELLLQQDRANCHAAEDCFRKAIEVAQAQEAKSWELRAATSLACLWAQQGKSFQARDLLAPVYAWFTEGFDTADLKDARTLLDQLT
jgi:predicted ATPase